MSTSRRHKNLPTFSPRQRICIFGIAAIVLAGVVWSQWFMTNLVQRQTAQEFYNDLPDVSLAALLPDQRTSVIRELNATRCPCNCGLTLASCRNRDRKCQTSLNLSKELISHVVAGRQ